MIVGALRGDGYVRIAKAIDNPAHGPFPQCCHFNGEKCTAVMDVADSKKMGEALAY